MTTIAPMPLTLRLRAYFTPERRRRWLRCALIFALFFVLQLKSIYADFFDTDEFDIYAGGEAIFRGFLLYRDYISQHMPVSYYISALFWALGARSVIAQRICFYVFFAAFWTMIGQRYRRVVSDKALFVFPILLILCESTYSFGTAILSEHLTGLGLVILLLEYMLFCRTDRLSTASCALLSFAILLTFGTTFVSAFALVPVLVAVVLHEIVLRRRGDLHGGAVWLDLWRKYRRLLAFCLAPWVLYLCYLIATGTLYDCYYGAYVVNREFYPLYATYGTHVLASVLGGFDYCANLLLGIASLFNGSFSVELLCQLILFLLAALAIIRLFLTHRQGEAGLLTALLLTSSTRGTFNYHGTQWVALVALAAATFFFPTPQTSVHGEQSESGPDATHSSHAGWSQRGIAALALFGLVLASPFFSNLSYAAGGSAPHDDRTALIMETITEPDEGIWKCALGYNHLFLQSQRAAICAVDVPWIWDAYGADTLASFADEPPRVCLFDPEASVWNHAVQDYAPELLTYIDEHYVRYTELIYIRRDYYDEANERINGALALQMSCALLCESSADRATLHLRLTGLGEEADSVFIPVWSTADGQDDIVWYDATRQGDEWVADVPIAAHTVPEGSPLQIHAYAVIGGEMELISYTSYYPTSLPLRD